MGGSKVLHQLASVAEQFEAAGHKVTELRPHGSNLLSDDGLTADLTISGPLLAEGEGTADIDFAVTDTSLDDDGTLSIDVTIGIDGTSPGTPAEENTERTGLEAELTDGGAIVGPERASSETANQSNRDASHQSVSLSDAVPDSPSNREPVSVSDGSAQSEESAYKDPDRLADVYDPDLTFDEMTDRLDVDVTPQTVRRYMIKYGVHNTDSTGTDPADDDGSCSDSDYRDADETAAAIAETVDLPRTLTTADITDAVCTARTLYEVHNELGIDRGQAQRLLSELNLLELVHGRLTTASTQSKSREEVQSRILEAVTDSTPVG